MKTLKVRAVEESLVQDYKAMQDGVRRFIGRKFDADAGGWILLECIVEVPNIAEYRHEIKQGNLIAADYQTATLCGVSLHNIEQYWIV